MVAIAVVAAAGIGIGLSTFTKTTQPAGQLPSANPSGIGTNEAPQSNGTTIVTLSGGQMAQGYPNDLGFVQAYGLSEDEADYLASSNGSLLAVSSDALHIAMMFPDGLKADRYYTVSDREFTPSEEEIERSEMLGSGLYVLDVSVTAVSDSAIKITQTFFVPYESLPAEVAANFQTQPVSQSLEPNLIPYADAAGSMGLHAVQETVIEVVKEFANQVLEPIGHGTKIFGKDMAGTAGGGFIQTVNIANAGRILRYNDRLMQEFEFLENCVKNPTNAITAKYYKEHPEEMQKALDGLKAARLSTKVTSFMRVVNTGAVALSAAPTIAAPAPISIAWAGIVGGISGYLDADLKERLKEDMADAKKNVVPCSPPCKENPATPQARPTSGENFIVRPAWAQESEICLPSDGRLRVVIDEIVTEEQGSPVRVTFEGEAAVSNIELYAGLPYVYPDRYFGEGYGFFHSRSEWRATGSVNELEDINCIVDISGNGTMKVEILRHMSGPIKRAEWMPGEISEKLSLAEVHVHIDGNFTYYTNSIYCGGGYNGATTTTTEGYGYVCDFFDVDERGGTYHNGTGPDNDRLGANPWFYDDCQLVMGRLTPGTTY